MSTEQTLLETAFRVAIAAADPRQMLGQYVPWESVRTALAGGGRVVVVGAGKAGASMALAFEQAYCAQGLDERCLEGLVVTRYGHGLPTRLIQVVQASHPVPDAAGEQAARDILSLVQAARPQDYVVTLISGGGSALLSLPIESVSAVQLRELTSALLASGAPIQEMNVVRKHLSRIQGGRLAQACAAPMLSLIISDVAGDDLSAIASGPTVPDQSTFADAQAVLARWGITPAASIAQALADGTPATETPKPGAPVFARIDNRLIASARQSLMAAAQVLEQAGYATLVLGDSITGEARDVAQVLAAVVREATVPGSPLRVPGKPLAIISGGECTVTLREPKPGQAPGRGGRCTEFLLALFHALGSAYPVAALAGDTDGIDGSQDNAGAFLLPGTAKRAQALQLRAGDYLDRNDGYGFFSALDSLVSTGPTLTNVNDFRVILVP
jgi:glycerate 2-kinase